MEPSWKQADVFPIIARIIEQACRERQGSVSAKKIAERLLEDTVGRNLIEAAREKLNENQELEWRENRAAPGGRLPGVGQFI